MMSTVKLNLVLGRGRSAVSCRAACAQRFCAASRPLPSVHALDTRSFTIALDPLSSASKARTPTSRTTSEVPEHRILHVL